MLSAEDNVSLTRTGAGTVMGDLFRRFWIPVLLGVGASALATLAFIARWRR